MHQKSKNCIALAKIILQFDLISFIVCECCFHSSKICICMNITSKCAEYTHCGCLCILMSLNFLNCVQEKLKSQLNQVEAKHTAHLKILQQLNSKILCLHTTIQQNKSQTLLKIKCVAVKLDSDNDGMKNKKILSSLFNLNSLLNSMSSSFFLDSRPSSQTVKAFSHSFWDSVWVFKSVLRYCILFTWQDSELSH